jgi:hypothetical protein
VARGVSLSRHLANSASYEKSRIFLNKIFTGPSGVCNNVGSSLAISASRIEPLMGRLIGDAIGMPVLNWRNTSRDVHCDLEIDLLGGGVLPIGTIKRSPGYIRTRNNPVVKD